jgi:hypothetical protein
VKSPNAVIKPALEKGSDQYTQWVSMLWRETAKIPDPAAGRFFDTCRKYLEVSFLSAGKKLKTVGAQGRTNSSLLDTGYLNFQN